VLAPWLVAAAGVEHIGSTAVPGLGGKPSLDLMAGVRSLDEARDAVVPLFADGWVHDPHRPDALHFTLHRTEAGAANLHLSEPGSALWVERLAFRDALRGDPALAADYTALKRALAGEGLAAGKRELVAGALARSAIALPPPRPAGYDGLALAAALVAQWQLLALHAPTLELAAPTRVTGWRNSEALAHLTLQPGLLVRFLAAVEPGEVTGDLATNLVGTRRLAEAIDTAARRHAGASAVDLRTAVDAAAPVLLRADPGRRVTTLQGAITLDAYLRTRCVEAVVHGGDLVPPLSPHPAALAVAAEALTAVLHGRAPTATPAPTDPLGWVEAATGRRAAPPSIAGLLPLSS